MQQCLFESADQERDMALLTCLFETSFFHELGKSGWKEPHLMLVSVGNFVSMFAWQTDSFCAH
jgi:hypothetical protein